jgi:DNA polymerase epsilon subunit 2
MMLKQITERHQLFKPSTGDGGGKFKIYPVEHLLSCGRKLSKIITMGLLCQLKIGCYHLEDPTGIVQLDLSQTISFSMHQSISKSGCLYIIVVAEK